MCADVASECFNTIFNLYLKELKDGKRSYFAVDNHDGSETMFKMVNSNIIITRQFKKSPLIR